MRVLFGLYKCVEIEVELYVIKLFLLLAVSDLPCEVCDRHIRSFLNPKFDSVRKTANDLWYCSGSIYMKERISTPHLSYARRTLTAIVSTHSTWYVVCMMKLIIKIKTEVHHFRKVTGGIRRVSHYDDDVIDLYTVGQQKKKKNANLSKTSIRSPKCKKKSPPPLPLVRDQAFAFGHLKWPPPLCTSDVTSFQLCSSTSELNSEVMIQTLTVVSNTTLELKAFSAKWCWINGRGKVVEKYSSPVHYSRKKIEAIFISIKNC